MSLRDILDMQFSRIDADDHHLDLPTLPARMYRWGDAVRVGMWLVAIHGFNRTDFYDCVVDDFGTLCEVEP